MLLIHLSDIHFHSGEVGTPFDPYQMLRASLIEDAAAAVADSQEKLGAILVSGDIAYAGKREEFDFAKGWLEELATRCGGSLASVFTCPGNHDADRAIARRHGIAALHRAIKTHEQPISREAMIRGLLQDSESNSQLFQSIQQYNSFAQQFFCALSPEETVAKRALTLNDGSILRLWGLNSTLVSGEDDAVESLVVDPSFNQILRKAGEENLVMCHHPPRWLMDSGSELQSHLNASARLQLFGHEHDARVLRDVRYMHIYAGAVVPERDKAGWEPGYNIIQINVTREGVDRKLEVKVNARVWQRNPCQFRAKMDEGHPFFMHTIPLDPWIPPETLAAKSTMENAPKVEESDMSVTLVDPMDSVREIGIRFFKLTLSQRASIAGRLNLLEQEDEYKADFQRYRDVFRRAQERNAVSLLDEAVKEEENRNLG